MSQNPFVPGQSPVPQPPSVDELLRRADELPYGDEENELLHEALVLAQRQQDASAEYRVRLRLVASCQMTGDAAAVLEHFGWCAARHDEDPKLFPAQTDQCDLLWYQSWIPALLAADPSHPREQLLAELGHMETRFRQAGVGLSGVLHARFAEAFTSGHVEEAERWRAELAHTDRDEYSYCEVCTRAEQVTYLVDVGREEEALEVFDEIMEQGITCGEEPETVMGTVLLPLLRATRLQDAEHAHRLGYRLARDTPELIPVVARHVQFCAVTGNPARAVTLMARHLSWLAHPQLSRHALFESLVPLAVACDVVAADGYGDLPVRGARELTELLGSDEPLDTVEDLGYAAWTTARTLAEAFDARNGTDRYRRRLQDARVRVLAGFPRLPLSGTPPVRMERAQLPDITDTEGWIDEGAWALTSHDSARALAAVSIGLAASPTPRQRLALWGLRAVAVEGDERRAAVLERAAAYQELGLNEEAQLEREYGHVLAVELTQESVELVRSLLDSARSAELRGRLHSELALFSLAHGEQQPALNEFLQAMELADQAGDQETLRRALVGACWAVPLEEEDGALQDRLLTMAEGSDPRANQAYDLLYLRAVEALAVHNAPDTALEFAQRAAELAIAHRAAGPLHQITRFRVDVLTDQDRHAEAADALHVLNEVLEDLGAGGDAVALAWEARELVACGRAAEAFEVASDARHELGVGEDGSPGQWALVDRWFAAAAEASGFHSTAEQSWERSLTLGEQAWAEAPELADAQRAALEGCQSGRSLVELYLRAGDGEAVHTHAERALTLARALGDLEPQLLPVALQQLGRALAAVGDEAGLALLQEAESSARAQDDVWFAADCHDARGRALLDLGHDEDAVPVLLEAADAYESTGDGVNAALAEYAVAHTLQKQGRGEDAVTLYSASLDRVKAMPGQVRAVIAGAYAELLDELGRPLDAVKVRRLTNDDEEA